MYAKQNISDKLYWFYIKDFKYTCFVNLDIIHAIVPIYCNDLRTE